MTTRHRRYLAGFVRPRQPRTITTYAVHALDNSRDEILPRYHRDAAADDPWLAPVKSEAVQALSILISGAQAHTVVDTPIEAALDLRGFCEDAELTERQTEVVVLTGEGWSQRSIAEWLEVSQPTVWEHLRTGRHRLAGHLPLAVASRLASTLSGGVL